MGKFEGQGAGGVAGIADEQAMKQAARVASTAAVDLTSAPSAIDGVTLVSGDRVLIKNGSTANPGATSIDNGVYVFNGAGSAMTRSPDADEDVEIENGLRVKILEGTQNGGCQFDLIETDVQVGVDVMTFEKFPPPTFVNNTLFVDPTYGDNATAQVDNPNRPYSTYAAAQSASSANDKIVCAAGTPLGAVAPPHDLFIDAPGCTFTSVDISSGLLYGRLGSVEIDANGATIHPVSSETENGNTLKLMLQMGGTQSSERFAVGLYGGATYTYPDPFLDIQGDAGSPLGGVNSALLDLYGIGSTKPIINMAGTGSVRFGPQTSIRNVRIDGYLSNGGTSNCVGRLEDLDVIPSNLASYAIDFQNSNSAFNGYAFNINCTTAWSRCQGSPTQGTGTIDRLVASRLSIGNWNGSMHYSGGSVDSAESIGADATITVDDTNQINFQHTTADTMLGLVKLGNVGSYLTSADPTQVVEGRFTGVKQDGVTTVAGSSHGGSIFTENYSLTDSIITGFAGSLKNAAHPVMVGNIKNVQMYMGSTSNPNTSNPQTAVENKGRWQDGTVHKTGSLDTLRFPVSDDAVLDNLTFVGWPQASTDKTKVAIGGRNLLYQFGENAPNAYRWDDTAKRLEWELTEQPTKWDGATSRDTYASGFTFTGTIYYMGGYAPFDGVLGIFVTFEVFDNGGNWQLRTTAADAAAIEAALGTPGADVISTVDAWKCNIGMSAEISMTNCELNGAAIGQEITIKRSKFKKVVNTSYTQVGFEKYINYDDDAALVGNTAQAFSTNGSGVVTFSGFVHNLLDGEQIAVANSTDVTELANGNYNVTVIDDSTFTVQGAAGDQSGGTADWSKTATEVSVTLQEPKNVMQDVNHKKVGSTGDVVLTPPAGVTIDGDASLTLTGGNQGIVLFTDGINYFIK